jgi:MFS superfamily sulfate permease-like transporter
MVEPIWIGFGVIIGILIGAVMSLLSVLWISTHTNSSEGRETNIADEFENIWDSANHKAIEALIVQLKEAPQDFSDDEHKRFIDEKREKYICDMMALYQLKYEE